MKILLVEDDALIAEAVRSILIEHRYLVEHVDSCQMAKDWLQAFTFSLVILDLGLPDGDGQDLIRWMRKNKHVNPVLVLSSRGAISDRVAALDLGADDYLTKPFDLDELLARVRAAIRRPLGLTSSIVLIKDLLIDFAGCRVLRGDETIRLRPREYQLLCMLVERRGRVVSRQEIEDVFARSDQGSESNAAEVHVYHLRQKLGPSIIETVRGFGYVVRAD